jgi:hypothetical protein
MAGAPLVVQWWKRVLNGLVGKFGEPGRRWVGVPSNEQKSERGRDTKYWPGADGHLYKNIRWYTMRLEEYPESYHSIPAIAAFITAAGRQMLWDILTCAGRANTWYCDTDSVFTNRAGRDNLLSGGFIREGEVGYLRTVGVYDRVRIHGIRHYETPDGIKCSGVRHGEIRTGETREEYWQRQRSEDPQPVELDGGMSDG